MAAPTPSQGVLGAIGQSPAVLTGENAPFDHVRQVAIEGSNAVPLAGGPEPPNCLDSCHFGERSAVSIGLPEVSRCPWSPQVPETDKGSRAKGSKAVPGVPLIVIIAVSGLSTDSSLSPIAEQPVVIAQAPAVGRDPARRSVLGVTENQLNWRGFPATFPDIDDRSPEAGTRARTTMDRRLSRAVLAAFGTAALATGALGNAGPALPLPGPPPRSVGRWPATRRRAGRSWPPGADGGRRPRPGSRR